MSKERGPAAVPYVVTMSDGSKAVYVGAGYGYDAKVVALLASLDPPYRNGEKIRIDIFHDSDCPAAAGHPPCVCDADVQILWVTT